MRSHLHSAGCPRCVHKDNSRSPWKRLRRSIRHSCWWRHIDSGNSVNIEKRRLCLIPRININFIFHSTTIRNFTFRCFQWRKLCVSCCPSPHWRLLPPMVYHWQIWAFRHNLHLDLQSVLETITKKRYTVLICIHAYLLHKYKQWHLAFKYCDHNF